jgi:hypothetical protein
VRAGTVNAACSDYKSSSCTSVSISIGTAGWIYCWRNISVGHWMIIECFLFVCWKKK